MLHTRGLIH